MDTFHYFVIGSVQQNQLTFLVAPTVNSAFPAKSGYADLDTFGTMHTYLHVVLSVVAHVPIPKSVDKTPERKLFLIITLPPSQQQP